MIARELRSKRRKGVVGTGAMSDPYNPYEQEYRLTRGGALELIDANGFGGASIATKSDLVTRGGYRCAQLDQNPFARAGQDHRHHSR